MKYFKGLNKLIIALLVALFIIVSHLLLLINPINGSGFFANRAFAQTAGDTLGYNATFEEEWRKIGQMSTEEFAQRYDAKADYLQGISWDPTTAKYWDLFNRESGTDQQHYDDFESSYHYPDFEFGHYNFRLNQEELTVFKKNGFVVSERMGTKTFAEMFYRIYSNDLPVFVSADSILHAWHMSYDAMLKELEEEVLSPSLQEILQGMAENISEAAKEYGNGELEPSLKDVDYFLAVASSLLQTDEPIETYLNQDSRVAETLNFVKAEQLKKFNLFGRERPVDFSQFKPRGHYESSEKLRKYFQAMMWCGRIDLRIAGKPQEVSPRELGSAIIFHDLLKKSGKFELWQQFDEIIQTFVGWTDSMTFAQLDELLTQAQINSPADVNNLSSLEQLQNNILAGQFGLQNIQSHVYKPQLGQESRQLPRSFTVMGQKFILDSWVMSQVADTTKIEDGQNAYQYIPTGLDIVFAALRNNQVVSNLVARITKIQQKQPKLAVHYQHNLAAARNVIEKQDPSVWKDNIYMNWLATLRELSAPTLDSKYPEAMRTQPWAMKTLNTQLASWTQLRHDTILYAKQSYGATLCEYPDGFVEPRPEFWERFEQMVRLTTEQLKNTPLQSQEIQTKQVKFLEQFAQKLGILKEIAVKELAQQPLTEEETKFLKDIVEIDSGSGAPNYNGWYPKLFYSDPEDSGKWDALVADVHTHIGGGQEIVLHEGIGNVDLLMIAVDNGDDRMVFAGPVMSHYEFEVPALERKSDSEWKEDIKRGNVPPRPDWTKDYFVSAPSQRRDIDQEPW